MPCAADVVIVHGEYILVAPFWGIWIKVGYWSGSVRAGENSETQILFVGSTDVVLWIGRKTDDHVPFFRRIPAQRGPNGLRERLRKACHRITLVRKIVFVFVRVKCEANVALPQITFANSTPSTFLGAAQGWQKQRGQHGNDRDDYEQFYQCEGTSASPDWFGFHTLCVLITNSALRRSAALEFSANRKVSPFRPRCPRLLGFRWNRTVGRRLLQRQCPE